MGHKQPRARADQPHPHPHRNQLHVAGRGKGPPQKPGLKDRQNPNWSQVNYNSSHMHKNGPIQANRSHQEHHASQIMLTCILQGIIMAANKNHQKVLMY